MSPITRRAAFQRIVLIAVVLALVGARPALPDDKATTKPVSSDWPQFLGPERNGISPETGLLTEWPSDGPPEVWRVPGGAGMSGLAISGGRLLTLVQKSGRQVAVCLDAKTGKPLWERDLAPEYRNKMGDGPRTTPTIAGDTAFVFTGEGILAALQIADGKVLWQKNAVEEFGAQPAEYGMACSPLVSGDNVVVVIGAPQATVAAFRGPTGAVAWKRGEETPAGYSSPALIELAGRMQIVVFHGEGATGLDPAHGYPLWEHSFVTDFNCNIATPVAVADGVLLSAGENHGSVLLKLSTKGNDVKQFPVEAAWESPGPGSVLRSEWQTPLSIDGSLYGFDNVGGAGPISHLTCIAASTGKRNWQQLRFGKGNLIAADGKLFMTTIQGDLVIAKVNPQKYEELGRKSIVGKTRQAPALAGGLLYLRDEREIVCLDVRKK